VNHGMPFGLPVAGTGLLAVAWGLLRTA